LFEHIGNVISDQEWYQERRAYRPQLIAYTFAKLVYEVKAIRREINYKLIWDTQSVPECLDDDIANIAKIIFDIRKEKNPCSLCARMRRGALHKYAKEIGCDKLALGHHFDDAVETFMMNLFNEGRIGCFSPVTYLDRMDITVLRPLVYVPEKDIRYFINHSDLPILKSPCPADKSTDREEIKQLLSKLDKENKGIKYRIFGAMQRAGVDGFKTVDGDALKEI
jgi:tRNA(Ile)-lysidine synthase TilS/MesJ